MSNVQHKYFPPICLLMTKIIIQVSKELKETSINHNFLFPRHLRHLLEGCLLTSQETKQSLLRRKWKKKKRIFFIKS